MAGIPRTGTGLAGRPELPWPTDWRLDPWSEPRNLAVYVPAEWPNRATWHAARAHVAESLNRRKLPEIAAITPNNAEPTQDNDPDARPSYADIDDATQHREIARLREAQGYGPDMSDDDLIQRAQDDLVKRFGG